MSGPAKDDDGPGHHNVKKPVNTYQRFKLESQESPLPNVSYLSRLVRKCRSASQILYSNVIYVVLADIYTLIELFLPTGVSGARKGHLVFVLGYS